MSQKISFNDRYGLTTAVLNRTKELTRRFEKALERAVVKYEKQYAYLVQKNYSFWELNREQLNNKPYETSRY